MKKKCLYLFKAYKYVLGLLSNNEKNYYDRHVQNCDFCSELVNNVRKIPRSKLKHRVYMINKVLVEQKEFNRERRAKGCPAIGEIMDYVHGRLSSKKRAYIKDHTKTCKCCRENLRIIKKIEKELEEK